MKKLLFIFGLSLTLNFAFVSCQSSSTPTEEATESTQTTDEVPSIEEAPVVNEAPMADTNQVAPQKEGGAQ